MNQIREYSNRPLIVGIVAFVVGLILGLVVLGWWLFPVQWYDASPAELHSGYQDWWMRMAIISYGATGDAANAKLVYDSLGEFSDDALAAVKANPGNINPTTDLTIRICRRQQLRQYRLARLLQGSLPLRLPLKPGSQTCTHC